MASRQTQQGSFNLEHVKMLVANESFLVSESALTDAEECFEWTVDEIAEAIRRLRPRHWLKSNTSKRDARLMVDHYSLTFKKEKIYLHFSLDFVDGEETVLIESFHSAGGG